MSVKITPKLKPDVSQVDFEELNPRDCFIMDGGLWMKHDRSDNQDAFCLSNGDNDFNLCGTMVIPVNVEIKWSKPKPKRNKK